MKMTSAFANKMLKKLNEDKEFYRNRENEGCTYIAALDEEPLIPDYDYAEVAAKIMEIDEKTVKLKHAINTVNIMNRITVGEREMSVDEILVAMAQLNQRKSFLDRLRKMQPKTRISSGMMSSRKTAPEYQYINFDPALITKEYERVDAQISEMQIALDRFNQTFEFEVEID